MGYGSDRRIGETPVYRLHCKSFKIETVETQGDSPGWISRHHAVLNNREIYISEGKIWASQQEQPTLIDNDFAYILEVDQGRWHRVEQQQDQY